MDGIESGALSPLAIDYNTNTVKAISKERIEELMITPLPPEQQEDAWTGEKRTHYRKAAHDFRFLILDISKKEGKTDKINYAALGYMHPESSVPVIAFYVAYPDLEKLLDQNKILWYSNSGPFLLKDQVLHTPDTYMSATLDSYFPEGTFGFYFQVTRNKKGYPDKLQQYSRQDFALVKEEPIEQYSFSGKEGEVLYMTTALAQEKYSAEDILDIRTTVAEARTQAKSSAPPKNLMVYLTDEIILNHPDNAHLHNNGQELPTLLLNAAKNGQLNIYSSDSLSRKMTIAELSKSLKLESEGLILGDETQEEVSEELELLGAQLTIVPITWQVYFNRKGIETKRVPYAIGIVAPSNLFPYGLEKSIAYFSFEEVYHLLKQTPQAKYSNPVPGHVLNDLLQQNFVSFFYKATPLRVASPKKKKYPLIKI
ncbi:hypothetical protein [Rufibacter roseus]|uniref:Uncharacterized protein n=1 Tax=Rufibacter roseus TaxID=1567108 RepID=A0ABW2DPP1_9BACT|nr:hypothetical protein [Rufibacter roseus]